MTAFVNPRTAGVSGQNTAISNTPSGVAPTGTVGANGALTLGTALTKTYSGGVFLRFPAGALFSGSLAASYWCVMSSTTVGTAFNNVLGDIPTVPASTTAIVNAGPGAYTGVTGDVTVASFTMPGGTLGPNGSAVITHENSYNATAGAKLFKWLIGASVLLTLTRTTTGNHDYVTGRFRNLGGAARNSFVVLSESTAATVGAPTFTTLDTAAAQVVSFVVNTAVATDVAIVESSAITYIAGY